jgi:hypothetical protein
MPRTVYGHATAVNRNRNLNSLQTEPSQVRDN